MRKILLGIFFLFLLACQKEEPEVILNGYNYNYYQNQNLGTVTSGTAVVQNVNLSGQGSQQVNANATVVLVGNVVLDGLAVIGEVYVADGANVEINGPLQVSGGAKLTVEGNIKAESFAQIGDVYVKSATMTITDKYQVSGGTTLFLENAHIQTDQFVLIGDVQGLENDNTLANNIFSVIESTNEKYIHRSGGTNVCGPVIFTHNFDHNGNGSGETFVDKTTTTLSTQPLIYQIYQMDTTDFYQFTDQLNCTPLKEVN